MGMAASQARLCQLTSRKHTIGLELQDLSLQKTDLARDAQRVTRNYKEALSSKVLEWSNNSGVTNVSLSYSTLMSPGAANGNSPILLTNSSGKVVLNDKYKKYAEMISPKGSPGGDWKSHRTEILSALTGIPASQIDEANLLSTKRDEASENENKTQLDIEDWKNKEPVNYYGDTKVAKLMGSFSGEDLGKLYSTQGSVTVGTKDGIKSLADTIYENMSKYFTDSDALNVKDKTAFKKACDSFATVFQGYLDGDDDKANAAREANGISGESGSYKIDMQKVFSYIMSAYVANGGNAYIDDEGDVKYPIRNTESDSWKNWHSTLEEKIKAYKDASSVYESAINADNQVFTASQESQIAFFDQMFEAIVDMGWTHDYSVDDENYLNQMLQNNLYYVTTMEKNEDYDPESIDNNFLYDYDTTTASSFKNIFSVNDSEAQNEALVEYEYQKSLINAKESRIDVRMKNLETEQSAIVKMIESIEKTRDNNVETHFNIFS